MSGLGHFQTPMRLHLMSALHLEADILLQRVDVRCVPQADSLQADMGLANDRTPLFTFRGQEHCEALRRVSVG
jgi:hypothetical protein